MFICVNLINKREKAVLSRWPYGFHHPKRRGEMLIASFANSLTDASDLEHGQ